MQRKKEYTLEEIKAFADQYGGSRVEFFGRKRGAYTFAANNGLLDLAFPPKKRTYTDEFLLGLINKYATLSEFRQQDNGALSAILYGKFTHLKAAIKERFPNQAAGSYIPKGTRKPKKWTERDWLLLAIQAENITEIIRPHTHFRKATTPEFQEKIRSLFVDDSKEQHALALTKLPRFKASLEICDSDEQWKKEFPEFKQYLKYPEFEQVRKEIVSVREERRANEAAIRKAKKEEAITREREARRLQEELEKKLAQENAKSSDVLINHIYMLYLAEIILKCGKKVLGFGITRTYDDRLVTHHRNCAAQGASMRLLRTVIGNGGDIAKAETAIKAQLNEINAIYNTKIEGFKEEATSWENLDVILRHCEGFDIVKDLLDPPALAA